jgi:hypothetical protein
VLEELHTSAEMLAPKSSQAKLAGVCASASARNAEAGYDNLAIDFAAQLYGHGNLADLAMELPSVGDLTLGKFPVVAGFGANRWLQEHIHRRLARTASGQRVRSVKAREI